MTSVNKARSGVWFLRACVLVTCFLTGAGQASADPRTDYLTRLLRGSDQFRVRAQAAISLGRVGADSAVLGPLSRALRDDHPAVRAAAAAALRRLGDPRALPALRAAAEDAEKGVRLAVRRAIASLQRSESRRIASKPKTPAERGSQKYYVGVGRPGVRGGTVAASELERAKRHLQQRIAEMDQVLLAPDGERSEKVEKVLRSRGLTGFYVDSSIVSVAKRPGGGTRAEVSVIVGTYPGRDMRAMLRGAATVMGGQDQRIRAIEAAFTGALRRLGQALQAASR